jgi:hypothetical protein
MIRDGGAGYTPGPVPSETYPAEGVLDDMVGADPDAIPLILARYAALRAWILEREGAPTALVRHARSAARAHLAATPAEWPERVPLETLLRRRSGGASAALLEAAKRARSAGHAAGARALRQAAQRARWPDGGWPRPSPS